MKIAIDARFLGPEGTGIGKYTEKLIGNLQILDKKNKYFVILRKANWNLFVPKSNNFEKVLVDARWYGIKEQLLMPPILLKIKPDLVHFPHFNIPLLYPGKFVVTVHDLIKTEYKESSSTTRLVPIYMLKHAGYEFTIRQAVNRAKRILVPSNHTKNILISKFKIPETKIQVTYESADEVFQDLGKRSISEEKIKKVFSKYRLKKPFLLYVGNAFPYKNLDIILESIKFMDKRIKFVVASSRSKFVDRLGERAHELSIEKRLITTGFVSNEDLTVLYNQAEMLIFPSLSEGFGLPGLEAMASGCPVVCSNIPVFKEVYGDAAFYFDPKDPKDIAEKINQLTENRNQREALVKKGFEQVKKYSWRKMAQETLKVYEEAVI